MTETLHSTNNICEQTMKRNTYHRCLLGITVILQLLIVSCQNDEPFTEGYSGASGKVSELRFISDPMQKYNVTTRSSDAKEDSEKKIYSINIFFFTADGNYLTGNYLTGNPNAPDDGGYYKTGEGVALLKIDPDLITTGQGETFTVYAVANVDTLFRGLDNNGRPAIISQTVADGKATTPKQALESLVYQPSWGNGVSLGLPATGMPMAGSKDITYTGSNITPETERIIEMKALMARVDINLQISSEHGTAQYPSLLLTEWSVKNVPNRGSLTPTADGAQTGTGWTDWTKNSSTFTETASFTNGEGMKNLCTFYVFENMQNAEWVQDEGEDWVSSPVGVTDPDALKNALYPEGISDAQKQRYKPYLANKNATSVVLKGIYHTYNDQGSNTSSVYEVSYTLYLGGNHTDNFQVKRNHQYKNNITIKGLLGISGSEGEFTFDARVNVDEEENDFYISILRERNHDAHFCVTPMDVYMFKATEGASVEMDVTLSEVGSDGQPTGVVPGWIRMERISAEDMEAGTVDKTGGLTAYDEETNTGTHLATGTPWTAGNGKRAFFTTDLMDILQSNVSLTQHRDRIYFYIDEYLKSSTEPLTNPREAMVIMKYKENGVEKGQKTIILAQYPFLEVQVYGRNGNTSNKNQPYSDDGLDGTGDGLIYMEQIEEYLEHYDPLDNYQTEQIYEGLSWDATGQNENIDNRIGNIRQLDPDGGTSFINSWENYVLGALFTRTIIQAYGQARMTLNDTPRTAAEYCWNRNKRADSSKGSQYGTVTTGYEKCFLPGIRQMEDALTTYYNSFPEFQGNYYWSSTPAEGAKWYDGLLFDYYTNDFENTSYARATKSDNNGVYSESAPPQGRKRYQNDIGPNEYPDGGYAKRSEELRIRVFRSDLE